MSRVWTLAGTLLLILVIGATASNSVTAFEPANTNFAEYLVSLKNKPVTLQLASDKPTISLIVVDTGTDYVRLATRVSNEGKFITPNYFVSFSNILYVRNDTVLRGGQQVQLYTIALK